MLADRVRMGSGKKDEVINWVQTLASDFGERVYPSHIGAYLGTEEYIMLPAMSTEGLHITNIHYVFKNYRGSVKGVYTDLPITGAYGLFQESRGITYVEISSTKLTTVSQFFRNADSSGTPLLKVVIPYMQSNTDITQMFRGLKANILDLTETKLPLSGNSDSIFLKASIKTILVSSQEQKDFIVNSSSFPFAIDVIIRE